MTGPAGADLAPLQELLLAGLTDGAAPAQVAERCALVAPDPVAAAWVASWDPDLLALAGELVRTWGYVER